MYDVSPAGNRSPEPVDADCIRWLDDPRFTAQIGVPQWASTGQAGGGGDGVAWCVRHRLELPCRHCELERSPA